ncbi:unnamed protein product [Mucor circinelloides]
MLSSTVLQGFEWQLEKIDGAKKLIDLGNRENNGETMEWFNAIAEKIWRSVDPRIFMVVEDILEDTLARVAPKVIKAARVSDFDLGTAAPRIEKLQIFPPSPGQPPESIFGECEFSLRADDSAAPTPGSTAPHLTAPGASIRFKTSINAALDVRGELTKITGKIRFHIVTSPDMPFVSTVTISFTSAPAIETAVMPISKRLNVMRLPMLKTLVNEGVKLGFKQLVDPESLTIDVAKIMATQSDTFAIGLIRAEIRQVKRLKAASKDPENLFVTMALSSAEMKNNIKSTRVLSNKKDPIWNEDLYQLITSDDIKNDVYFNIKVMKADKVKTDQYWGSISASVKDITLGQLDENENVSSWCTSERVMYDGWVPIDGKSEQESDSLLNLKLTFHPKYVIPEEKRSKTEQAKREKLKQKQEKEEKKRLAKEEHRQSKKARFSMVFDTPEDQLGQAMKEIAEKTKQHTAASRAHATEDDQYDLQGGQVALVSDNDSDLGKSELINIRNEYINDDTSDTDSLIDQADADMEDAIEYYEPGEAVSPEHKSGILSIKITQAKDLEIVDPDLMTFKSRRHPYNADKSVNPYALVYVNDRKVFQTRSKMKASCPFWNADTECFLKNYDTSFIRISVKTSIDLEHDPVIGTNVLKISDLFDGPARKVREAERWITLKHGIGYGKVLLNVTYKPIKLTLPRELSGSDVGTLVIQSIQLTSLKNAMDSKNLKHTKATLSLNVEPKIQKHLQSNALTQEKTGDTWGWSANSSYFPLLMRYKTALFIQLSQGMGAHKSTARLWMKEIVDYDWQELTLGLHEYTPETADGNRDELPWGSSGPNGQIVLRLKFVPGFSPVHAQLPSFALDMLGADPFQKDDVWEKAHLLVQKEGSENYAIIAPITCGIDKDKRDQVLQHIEKSNQANNKRRASTLIGLNKSKKPNARQMSLATLTEKQRNDLVQLLQDKKEHPTVEPSEPRFNVFDSASYSKPPTNPASSNTTMQQAADTAHQSDQEPQQRKLSDTPATGFDVFKRNQGTGRASNDTAPTSDNNKRNSSSSGYDFYNARRVSEASTSSSASAPGTPPEAAMDPNTKSHQLMEIETATYLNAMRDDLKNSKIPNYHLLRKLSKGKDYFTEQFKTLRQGPNSEVRANKAVMKEV